MAKYLKFFVSCLFFVVTIVILTNGFLSHSYSLMLKYLCILLVGLFIGWSYSRILYYQEKNKKYEIDISLLKKGNSISSLSNVLRRLVYDFSVAKKNGNFLLDIKIKDEQVIQVLHRAHFVELLDSKIDTEFGLALYIPTDSLSETEKDAILNLVDELPTEHNSKPVEYIVIDVGNRVDVASYLLTNILKETFQLLSEKDLSYELFDEGDLPYSPTGISLA